MAVHIVSLQESLASFFLCSEDLGEETQRLQTNNFGGRNFRAACNIQAVAQLLLLALSHLYSKREQKDNVQSSKIKLKIAHRAGESSYNC